MTGDDTALRRLEDTGLPDSKLILYQLGELKAAVREGFAKAENRDDAADKRIAALERFRERVEERERAVAQTSERVNVRWVPIALWGATTFVTIVLAIIFATGN